jgi:hypothetical protein
MIPVVRWACLTQCGRVLAGGAFAGLLFVGATDSFTAKHVLKNSDFNSNNVMIDIGNRLIENGHSVGPNSDVVCVCIIRN